VRAHTHQHKPPLSRRIKGRGSAAPAAQKKGDPPFISHSRCRILLHPRTLAAREIGRVSVRTRCCQCREKNITVASSLLSALERAADRHQRPATRQAVPTSDEEARKRSNTPRPDLWCRSDRGAHGVVEHSSTSNTQSLFAPADSTRPKTVGLWPAMRRSPQQRSTWQPRRWPDCCCGQRVTRWRCEGPYRHPIAWASQRSRLIRSFVRPRVDVSRQKKPLERHPSDTRLAWL